MLKVFKVRETLKFLLEKCTAIGLIGNQLSIVVIRMQTRIKRSFVGCNEAKWENIRFGKKGKQRVRKISQAFHE